MRLQHLVEFDPDTGFFDVRLSSLRLLKNDGKANFSDVTRDEISGAPNTEHFYNGNALAVGDLDGDTDADVLITHSFLDRNYLYLTYSLSNYSFYGTSFWANGSLQATRQLERK